MKALVIEDGLSLRCDVPVPVPAAGEALVRVALAGVCGTDLELARGYMSFRGVPGHEFVGVVESAPDEALTGKRVVGEINCPCGICEYCRRGLAKHCRRRTILGIAGRGGAFAEYLALPAENLHVVPPKVPDMAAVFAEPLAACYEVLERGVVVRKARAIVLGDGKLGLLMAQVLCDAGADVTCVGKHPEKLAILDSASIDTALRGNLAPGTADIAVECTGSPEGLSEALELLRPRGTVFLKTTIASRVRLDLAKAVVDEITLIGSRCGPFPPAIRALREGRIHVDKLVEKVMPFPAVLEAFELAARPGSLKVVIRISDDE